MKTISHIILPLCLALSAQAGMAQSKRVLPDSLVQQHYNPQKGYFQKAGFDKNDPRFMIENEDGSFKFGVGGFVNVLSQVDFGGIKSPDFITSQIEIPTKHDPKFLLSPYASRVNFKIVGQDLHQRSVIAFIEAGYTGSAIALRHAYVSYAGFTIGQTWSTFMDLEAGVATVDGEGPNNQIAVRVPMIRYSHDFGKWNVGIAVEIGSQLYEFAERQPQFFPQNQRVPNIPLHVKYKDSWGHIQLSGVFKTMNYGDSNARNQTVYVQGYGAALSGTLHLWHGGTAYYQFVGGRGIGNYINDLSAFDYDLIPLPDANGAVTMGTLRMLGGYVGFQHVWAPKWSSNVVYGVTHLQPPTLPVRLRETFTYGSLYKLAHYVAVNTFWEVIPHGQIGIEYLYGKKINLQQQSGDNHRVNLSVRYHF